MIVLFVACASRVRATPGRHAILTVVRASKRMAVPDVMVLLVPRIVLPLVVVVTGRIAAGPMVVLPEACAAWVRAALCPPAIFPVI